MGLGGWESLGVRVGFGVSQGEGRGEGEEGDAEEGDHGEGLHGAGGEARGLQNVT